jgi:hypothetical protein
MPELPEQDSMELEAERSLLYRQFLAGISPIGDLMEPVTLPDFSFNDALAQRWNYNLTNNSFNPLLFNGFSGISPLPYLRNGTIFSEGSYQLNEKFRLGGYSFGGNSIFSAPFPNQNRNNYDFRGSTLFMEYKVSDKFKIQTSVSVSQGR